MFDIHDLELMLQALSICLVLTGIHGYLGIHVLERKVIFVDLAMAQIAALGATFALFLGYDAHEHPLPVYFFSLTFTLIGAAVFSLTRMRHERIPQEAFIGIIYASASAIAILILAKSATAGEEIKGMLVGNILLARWPDIAKTAGIYSVIGAFHWFYRERFFRISMDPEAAFRSGMNIRLWDFLFYATFGVVITSSVAIAGVLLVFSFLVVPACIGVMFGKGRRGRILTAWSAGTIVSFLGIWFTFQEGTLPAGPVVVASFALVLVVSALARYILSSSPRLPAVLRVVAGGVVVAALIGVSSLLRVAEPETPHVHDTLDLLMEELRGGDEGRQLHAIDHFMEVADPHALPGLLELLDRTGSDRVLEHLAAALKVQADPKAVPALLKRARTADPALQVMLADTVLSLKDSLGLQILMEVAGNGDAPRLARVKALRLYTRMTGRKVGTEPGEVEKEQAWLSEHREHLHWHEATRRFE